jgi:pimeloyl-ACP methyl ester carboxylesterase
VRDAAASGAPQRITVDGAQIAYRRRGGGPPMLWLHGAGGVDGWTEGMQRLSESYDLIVPDHPGWGASDTPAWLDNIHDLAYFYLDFIDALGLDGVHLIGTSIGGWIAAEVAIRNTARLRTLTLIAPAGLRAEGLERFDIFLATRETMTRALYDDQALAERALAATPAPDALERSLKNRFATARVAWQPRLYDPHLAKWLHRIDVPTLVMWGDHDAVLPPALQAEFVRLIPGARAITIADCGHMPLIERAEAAVARIDAFIAEAGA